MGIPLEQKGTKVTSQSIYQGLDRIDELKRTDRISSRDADSMERSVGLLSKIWIGEVIHG